MFAPVRCCFDVMFLLFASHPALPQGRNGGAVYCAGQRTGPRAILLTTVAQKDHRQKFSQGGPVTPPPRPTYIEFTFQMTVLSIVRLSYRVE